MMINLDYLEALNLVGSGIEIADLVDYFPLREEGFSFIRSAQDKGHIIPSKNPDGRNILKLTPEGKSYIKKESEFIKKWYKKPEWWGIIVSGLIGIAGVIIGYMALMK